MKKLSLISIVMTLFVAFGLCSCGGGSKGKTPADISISMWEQVQKGDYKKAAEIWYNNANLSKDALPEELSEKEAVDMFASKLEESQAGQPKIKEVKMLKEEIDEAAGKASVEMRITYDDGKEETEIDKYVKVDGAWKMDTTK